MATDTDLGLEIGGTGYSGFFTASRYSLDGNELLGEFRDKGAVYIFTAVELIPTQRVTTHYTQNG